MKVCVGIPAFNEERTVGLVAALCKPYGEVYVWNDGSTDETELRAEYSSVEVRGTDRNRGYGYALHQLFRIANEKGCDVLVTLDADGQHDPSDIPRFLDVIESGGDVAVGNRFLVKVETGIPTHRKVGITAFSKVVGFQDAQCGFRGYSRRAIETLNVRERGMGASVEILKQARRKGLKIVEVPCTVHYPSSAPKKRSSLMHGSSLAESLLWLTVWQHPLLYLGVPSMGLLLTGVFSAILVIAEWSSTRYVPLSAAVLGLGGILAGLMTGITAIIVWAIKRAFQGEAVG